MSNRFLIKKSSVAGRIPLAGDLEYGELALNYTDGKLYYKTSSNSIASLVGADNYVQIDRQSYTATAGQVTFSITYAASYVDVYINGVHMSDEDYTATSGSTVVLTQACSAGDQVDLMGFSGSTNNGNSYISNANTATALATGRTIAITGDITYTSGSFDGTSNITGAATLATINSNVGSFGSTTVIPVITVNAKGLVTAVSTANISGSISITGGDLTLSGNTGTAITNATLATVNSDVGSFGSTTVIPVITVNAKGLVTAVSTANISGSISVTGGDLTLSGNTGTAITNATLATVNSNVGSYGSVTAVPLITVNAKGLITGVTTSTITPAVGSITGFGSGVATFLATPSSANLAAALTDESGTNTVAFTTSPTFITPILGDATVTSITYDHSRLQSNTATTTATTADQVLVSLAGASYRSAEFQIQATDATGSKYHTATIKALHNGTSAVHTEFSSLNIGGVCATFDVDYSGGNLRLLCTPSSVNSTVFKITSIIGKV